MIRLQNHQTLSSAGIGGCARNLSVNVKIIPPGEKEPVLKTVDVKELRPEAAKKSVGMEKVFVYDKMKNFKIWIESGEYEDIFGKRHEVMLFGERIIRLVDGVLVISPKKP